MGFDDLSIVVGRRRRSATTWYMILLDIIIPMPTRRATRPFIDIILLPYLPGTGTAVLLIVVSSIKSFLLD